MNKAYYTSELVNKIYCDLDCPSISLLLTIKAFDDLTLDDTVCIRSQLVAIHLGLTDR